MANVLIAQGTEIVWGTSGGAGITSGKNILLDNLASGAAREGVYADLGATFSEWYRLWIVIETGTAPAAERQIDVHLNWSYDGTNWSGGGTGTDAAFTLGTNDVNLRNINGGSISGLLQPGAAGNTTFRSGPFDVLARGRYVSPIVVNRMDVAIRNQTTDSDNTSRIILVPFTPQF